MSPANDLPDDILERAKEAQTAAAYAICGYPDAYHVLVASRSATEAIATALLAQHKATEQATIERCAAIAEYQDLPGLTAAGIASAIRNQGKG